MPSTSVNFKSDYSEDNDQNEELNDEDDYKNYESPEQISSNLVTLSLLPDSRWNNLVNLDVIRVSNCI